MLLDVTANFIHPTLKSFRTAPPMYEMISGGWGRTRLLRIGNQGDIRAIGLAHHHPVRAGNRRKR